MEADNDLSEAGSSFELTLKQQAHQLVDSLEEGNLREAVQLINELNQVRDNGLYQEVGKLTRELHNAIADFHIDTHLPGAAEASEITDATERLTYVVKMTEKAANRTMDLVEQCAPLVNFISYEAQSLISDWQRFRRREMDAAGFRELANRLDAFLTRTLHDGDQLSKNLNEIMLAQDYQDLTGQVIKRVTKLVTDVESNLVKLVFMASRVDRYAGIEHDLAERDKRQQERRTQGEGPQMNTDKRTDVVSSQDDVDDLLSSLGF